MYLSKEVRRFHLMLSPENQPQNLMEAAVCLHKARAGAQKGHSLHSSACDPFVTCSAGAVSRMGQTLGGVLLIIVRDSPVTQGAPYSIILSGVNGLGPAWLLLFYLSDLAVPPAGLDLPLSFLEQSALTYHLFSREVPTKP